MAIQSGIGVGEAQVYNTNGSLNTYARLIAKQQAERAAEQKALAEQMSKVKIDGVREADRDIFIKDYEDIKTMQLALNKAKGREAIDLKSKMNQRILNLGAFGSRSKSEQKQEDTWDQFLMDNNKRDQLTPDAFTKLQNNKKLSILDKDYISDRTTLERRVDTSKILDDLNNIDDQLLQTSGKYDNPITRRVTSGNKTGTESIYTKRVDPKTQAFNYAMMYDVKPEFKSFVKKEYADLFNQMGEDEAKVVAIKDLITKRPLARSETPKMEWDRAPDNFYAHYDYRQDNPSPPKGVEPTYNQDLFNRVLNQEKGSPEEMMDAVKSGIMKSGGVLKDNFKYIKTKDGNIKIEVPTVYGKVKDGEQEVVRGNTTFTYNPSDKEKSVRVLSNLMNIYTGESVPQSSILTQGGKKKVVGGQGEKGFKNEDKVITFKDGGVIYNIPSDKVSSFLKAKPNAKKQ